MALAADYLERAAGLSANLPQCNRDSKSSEGIGSGVVF
jgi:hypothetical protein